MSGEEVIAMLNTGERRFPLIWPWRREEERALVAAGCPRTVAWSLIAPHEAQAQSNHGQSLEQLAARGGLSPAEALAVLTDRAWRDSVHDDARAVPQLLQLIIAHEARAQGVAEERKRIVAIIDEDLPYYERLEELGYLTEHSGAQLGLLLKLRKRIEAGK